MKKYNNQNGFAASILVILIAGVIFIGMGTALAAFVSTQTKTVVTNENVLKATYAAEAGAKRFITEMSKKTEQDFTWLNKDKALINDVSKEKYNVIVYLASDTKKTPVTTFTNGGLYTIQSTGTINNKIKKVITYNATVSAGTPASIFAIYAGGNLTITNGVTVNHAPVAAGNSMTINAGNINNDTKPVYNGVKYEEKAYAPLSCAIPSISLGDYGTPVPLPIDTSSNSVNMNGGVYTKSGGWTLGNNMNLNGSGKNVVYIDGDLVINSSSLNWNPETLLVVNGNIIASGDVSFSNAVVICYGDVTATNGTFNINTGSLIASGNITLKTAPNINYSSDLLNAYGIISSSTSATSTTTPTAIIKPGTWHIK